MNAAENKLVLAHIWVALGALFVGTSFGLLQVYSRAGAHVAEFFDYYRLLTAHGVLLAIVFTTFFICAIATHATYSTQRRENRSLVVAWTAWTVMLIGTVMAAFEILAGNATVLYTFYAPLKADPWFYVGATLLIVGSWIVMVDILMQNAAFKKANPGKKVPLPAFISAVTFVMWFIATLGVAAEVLLLLIPWAFGWVSGVDVHLSRILFWYFGHPLVYFWIMGAYIIWYTVIPEILEIPVWSDSLTRLTFLLLLVLSCPIGIHHELMDPGISPVWKMLQVGLTLAVVLPSLMTAFALFATFETYATKQGKTGFAGVVGALPWSNPAFAGIALSMILFIFGGFGGLVNASYSMDILVHNTMWVVGHFHITVGGPVALTFMAVSYLMIPKLTGRRLMTPRMAMAQVFGYFVGMSIMSIGMHVEGLLGAPRRTATLDYGSSPLAATWEAWAILAAIGGTIIIANIILYALCLLSSAGIGAKGNTEFAYAQGSDPEESPWWLNRIDLWAVACILMVVIAYAGPMWQHFHEGTIYLAPGARTW